MEKSCQNCNFYYNYPTKSCKYDNIKQIERLEFSNNCPFFMPYKDTPSDFIKEVDRKLQKHYENLNHPT